MTDQTNQPLADVDLTAIAQKMMAFGGSFACRLGDLYLTADSANRANIEKTWPQLFEKYRHALDPVDAKDSNGLRMLKVHLHNLIISARSLDSATDSDIFTDASEYADRVQAVHDAKSDTWTSLQKMEGVIHSIYPKSVWKEHVLNDETALSYDEWVMTSLQLGH